VFLNIVLDDAVEEKDGGEKVRLGMVVIRGNSVVMLEALERIGGGREDRG
jgi:small nuclear ribonucleoprotein G